MPLKLFAAFVITLSLAGYAAAQENHIAAVVNEEVITTDDLNNRVSLLIRSSGLKDDTETRQRLGSRVLRTLIDERLQLQEAKRLSITVPKEEIDAALARIEAQNNMAKGGLEKFLQNFGIPRSVLVDQLTASLTWNKLVSARLAQDITVTDAEVNEALKHVKEAANTPISQVSEIFLAVDNPSQEEEVHRLADRLEEQLHSGQSGAFPTIAQQFSQSPTAAVGGDLGWITPNDINPELAKVLADMKPGEFSQPIRAGGGYYILQLGDRRMPGQASAEDTEISAVEAGAPVPPNAPPGYRQKVEAILHSLLSSGQSCQSFLAAAKKVGLPFVKQVENTRVLTLSAPVRRVVLQMTPGQLSKPFGVEGGLGMIMLCAKRDPQAPKPMTPDQVRDTIGREHLDVLARRYMRDLRRGSYVDIRG